MREFMQPDRIARQQDYIMVHLRIIGSLWVVSCIVPTIKLAIELGSLMTQPEAAPQGAQFWITQLLVEASFFLIIIIGWSLWRPHRWAVLAAGIWSVISLGICAWFILTQGMDHGPEPYITIWCGVALSLYTFFGVWRFSVGRGQTDSSASGPKPNGTVA